LVYPQVKSADFIAGRVARWAQTVRNRNLSEP
jgi:hypothetical protein